MPSVERDDLGVVPAEAADVPGVIDLIARVFAEYRFVWDPLTEVPDLLAFDRHYRAPRGAFFVVRRNGRVVGSVGVERGAEATAELHRLYLDADLRGQGRGRALVEAVLRWCRASGIGHLVLWSDTRFAQAHALYQRMGFRRTGARDLAGDPNQTREYRYERAVGPAVEAPGGPGATGPSGRPLGPPRPGA
ncbi:MAG: N-acetyltransferase [Candidatus Rokuibacteriota bacterium]|nr:MAG: N-acetyltransferase [Candidatus Rokubacteria bacterium]